MTTSPDMPGLRAEPWGFLGAAAADLGFAAAGAAPAEPLPEPAIRRFRSWRDAGHHGTMAYLDKYDEQRVDPRHPEVVADAAVVVCAALPYADGAAEAGIWRYVAAHARGRDYHATMRQRLGALARAIEARFPQCRWRAFVDTGPVLERAWAVMAGLGSIGRHGGLIVPGTGARVVLGEIICTGVPTPPRAAAASPYSQCGDCRQCIEACPSGAIVDSGTVDARRCLSYHTIENRVGPLPDEIGDALQLVFGCDECTTACPLEDRTARCGLEPPPVPGPPDLDPAGLVEADDEQIARLVGGTCLERTGVAALRRNAEHLTRRGRFARQPVS